MQVLAGIGEVGTLAAIKPAAIDEQGFVSIVERDPPDLVAVEVDPDPLLDPVEQLEPVLVLPFIVLPILAGTSAVFGPAAIRVGSLAEQFASSSFYPGR